MLTSKYLPFREKSQEFKLNLGQKQSAAFRKDLAVNYPDGSPTLILKSESNLIAILSQNKVEFIAQQYPAGISNFVALSERIALAFYRQHNSFVWIDTLQRTVEDIQTEKPSEWESTDSQLYFFKDSKQLYKIDKDYNNDRLRITFYEVEQKKIKQTHQQVLEQNQWSSELQIFKVNEAGLLGWCAVTPDALTISLYSREDGFKVLQEIDNICKTDIKILALANSNSNLIHVAIQGSTSQEQLPLLIIQTLNNFGQVKEVRFARQEAGRKQIRQPVTARNIGNFIAIQLSSSSQTHQVYLYSLENQSIVGQSKDVEAQQLEISQNTPFKDQFISYVPLNSLSQISGSVNTWHRVNSLSVLKLLESIKLLVEASKEHQNVLIIFGAHMSGKSTLRHYFCGEQLQYFLNEGGFYQVKVKNDLENLYVEQLQKNLTISTSVTQHGVIIQVPDWTHSEPIFCSQIYILMQIIFKSFKKLHTVVTISEQYVQDSSYNEHFFSSVLKILKQQETGISTTISIVLTKIEDESTIEMFKERIEEILELNEEIGTVINSISQADKIYVFQNKEHDSDEGKAMLEKIVESEPLPLQPTMSQKIKQAITAEGMLDSIQLVKKQTSFYYTLISQILNYFSHLSVGCPQHFAKEYFRQQVFHIDKEAGKFLAAQPEKTSCSNFIIPLFNVLGQCKLFAEKKEDRTEQKIEELRKSLIALADQFQGLSSKQQGNYLRIAFDNFVTVLKISNDCLKVKEDEDPFLSGVEILKSNSNILGKRFISVIKLLAEQKSQIKSSALMTALTPFMKEATGPVIVITKTVPMTYNEQKSHYLKQSNKILEVICSLPANVMKLDLMIEQLIIINKAGVSDDNMRETRYYLRQCSRICQFHKCYLESIVFLLVIPDFAGIGLLLDDLVDHCKATSSYESKKLFDTAELELLDELRIVCRTCLRESLLQKLIYLRTLNTQSSRKGGQLKNIQNKLINQEISKDSHAKYIEMLQNQSDLPFFNLKNESYKKVIEGRAKLIERCKDYEESQSHKCDFQKYEAINWLVETLPCPTH